MSSEGQQVVLPPDNERFTIELEFLQCLANPSYLNFLAQQGYFDNPDFIDYLRYLKYWKRPEYSKFIVYPHCLAFLDQLTAEDPVGSQFRLELKKSDCAMYIHKQQYYHWLSYRSKRSTNLGDS